MATQERIVVGIDIGTTKVVTLVAEVGGAGKMRVLGLGIESAEGMSKGSIVDVAAVTHSVETSRRNAERSSGYEIGRAFVSVAGRHTSSVNSRGVTGLNPSRGVIRADDVERALEAARAIALPHNQEVLHVIPRSFILDGQEGIRNPLGLHAYRLEVEAHIITAGQATLRNLEKCIHDAGVQVDRFVLNPIASGEEVLTEAERESGTVLIDIGGGTSDLAVFIDGTVWHTASIEVGGNLITNDIAQVLHLPFEEAERIKVEYGDANPDAVPNDISFAARSFGREVPVQVYAHDVAQIIEARIEEVFTLVMQELKRSGYDGLLPAGAVLTGGTANLGNIRSVATRTLRMPVRIGQPEEISGMVDRLRAPNYATSVGLLRFARNIDMRPINPESSKPGRKPGQALSGLGKVVGDFLGRLLPGDE